jgi:precorrin-6A/cobalt-precorrin-6A reductase
MPMTRISRIRPVSQGASLLGVRVLLLGGTGEARELAARLLAGGDEVTSSLAGRVRRPALPAGPVRIGGFGGIDGLAAYLVQARPEVVIDATHPFAATITAHAAAACARCAVPLLVLRRPGWTARPGDRWTRVADITAAAAHVAAAGTGTVFLTTGRRDLAAFAADRAHTFLVRAVERPAGPGPPRMTLLLDRGPYRVEAETGLMRRHGVRLLVTKDSGGERTAAKLAAARELCLPVIVVDRPALPDGLRPMAGVTEVLAHLAAWGTSPG